MEEYLKEQIKSIEEYKWIASEKANKDLGERMTLDWVEKFSAKKRNFWKITHLFIPADDN